MGGGATATHTYAADGRRRTANGSVEGIATLIYDGDLCIGYVNTPNSGLALRITGAPGTWGGLVSEQLHLSGTLVENFYYALDQQGSVRSISGAQQDWKAFGVPLSGASIAILGYEGISAICRTPVSIPRICSSAPASST
jgi:hypothetical protein